MKYTIALLYLLIGEISFSQTTPVSPISFNTVNDLKLQTGQNGVQVLVNGLTIINDGNGGLYMWSDTCTIPTNGFTIVQATGIAIGRWMRLSNANTIKGTTTFSATILTSTYNVNHGLPFAPLQIYIQARSANAAVPSWVSTIDATKFVVNFASVPVLGTNNITIDWLAIKQ